MIKGASLFSSAGIGEYYLKDIGIDIKVANEIIPMRAELYSFFHPTTKMICGDITDKNIFDEVNDEIKKNDCKFLIATPPCQGMSTLGKKEYDTDERNLLFYYVIDMIKDNDFDYILIENVQKFIKIKYKYKNDNKTIYDILKAEIGKRYIIEENILNAKDYGVPQSRPRSILKIYKYGLVWGEPKKQNQITLKDSIGDLPSIESGQGSDIKWHFARSHNEREVIAMRYTVEGKSAIYNPIYYPKKPNGDRIKGFHNTYKRMKWNAPAPTRAINNGSMGGTNNVHPGRLQADGTYSDARVLTLRETFIVSSLPADLDLPEWCSETLIRTVIGEAVPPKLSYNIVKEIGEFAND